MHPCRTQHLPCATSALWHAAQSTPGPGWQIAKLTGMRIHSLVHNSGQNHQANRAGVWTFPNHVRGWCHAVKSHLITYLRSFHYSPCSDLPPGRERGTAWQEILAWPSKSWNQGILSMSSWPEPLGRSFESMVLGCSQETGWWGNPQSWAGRRTS